jgi:TctA family transporter
MYNIVFQKLVVYISNCFGIYSSNELRVYTTTNMVLYEISYSFEHKNFRAINIVLRNTVGRTKTNGLRINTLITQSSIAIVFNKRTSSFTH